MGSQEILRILLDPLKNMRVDPRKYVFRMFMTLKTSDERYAEDLNFGVWVGSGMWRGDQMVFE